MNNKEKELIKKLNKKEIKERWTELFVKSCTQELNKQEQREKDKLEKVIVKFRIR